MFWCPLVFTELEAQYQTHSFLIFLSFSGSPASSYSEVKSSKTVSRKRWARSVSFELGGDLYAVDLEEGYRPLGYRNSSWARDRRRGVGNEEDNEEFSGMGVTAKPTSSNRLTPPAALKVTYRCCCVQLSALICKCKRRELKFNNLAYICTLFSDAFVFLYSEGALFL